MGGLAGRSRAVWHAHARVARALTRGVVAASVVYIAFLACWGLNYRRPPITERLDFDRSRVTAAEVDAASRRAVAELNRLHQPAHADLQTTPTLAAMRVRLAPAFTLAQRALGQTRLATAGRPKISMLSPFFRWATVDGMVNPLGLEVIVNPEVLPVEQPFVIAHEWGHLAGWARESEASYVGWLTCRAGDHLARYSGWLSLYWHLRRELPRDRVARDRRLAGGGAPAGPGGDCGAIATRPADGAAGELAHVRPVPEGQSRGRGREELRRGGDADPWHRRRRRGAAAVCPPRPSSMTDTALNAAR